MEQRFLEASELMEKPDFIAELEKATSDAEIIDTFGKHGVVLSAEDVENMTQEAMAIQGDAEGEIDLEEADNVSGGVVLTLGAAACITAASCSFFAGYGWQKYGKRKKK